MRILYWIERRTNVTEEYRIAMSNQVNCVFDAVLHMWWVIIHVSDYWTYTSPSCIFISCVHHRLFSKHYQFGVFYQSNLSSIPSNNPISFSLFFYLGLSDQFYLVRISYFFIFYLFLFFTQFLDFPYLSLFSFRLHTVIRIFVDPWA